MVGGSECGGIVKGVNAEGGSEGGGREGVWRE